MGRGKDGVESREWNCFEVGVYVNGITMYGGGSR
jgi:hypothetical protein